MRMLWKQLFELHFRTAKLQGCPALRVATWGSTFTNANFILWCFLSFEGRELAQLRKEEHLEEAAQGALQGCHLKVGRPVDTPAEVT